jgi:pyruvate/2-oxoglutarate dehydrogenase complex dihydrolipoamide dehydrogenase (E3) component
LTLDHVGWQAIIFISTFLSRFDQETSMNSTAPHSSTDQPDATRAEDFDILILGGGTGSTVAAWTFAKEGKRVAVVDRKYIGGSCPNIACLPSKNIIHSAQVANYVRHSEEYGVTRGDMRIDMSVVRGRKRAMVSALNAAYLENYKATGAEFILGSGQFVAPKTLEVTLADGSKRWLRGTNVIVSTGTHATIEPIPGLIEAQPLTHVGALELDDVPRHLVVLGGGYIGIELSQAMRRFGSKVTMIERGDKLLPREDDDLTGELRSLLADEGIDILMNAKIGRVSGKSGESVKIAIEHNGVEKMLEGSHVLVAMGRTPNTEGLGLEPAGIERTDRGFLKVNERLQTTAPGVWGIGEVAGSPLFTHVSIDDFRVVHANINGGNRVTTGRLVPYCLFTDPEIAHVGLREKDARAQGIAYRRFKIPMAQDLRAVALGETRGFMKALVDSEGGRILGFTVFGVGAGEIMSSVQIAMISALPYTAINDAILAHPTLVEGLGALFGSQPWDQNLRTQTAHP